MPEMHKSWPPRETQPEKTARLSKERTQGLLAASAQALEEIDELLGGECGREPEG